MNTKNIMKKMPLGQTLIVNAPLDSYTQIEIIAALEQSSYHEDNLKLKLGDTTIVTDTHGKSAKLKVFKILGAAPHSILMLVDSAGGVGVGLTDRLMMACQVFKGDFFKK